MHKRWVYEAARAAFTNCAILVADSVIVPFIQGEYTDMIQAGILDPLKVVKTALVDASGVASLLTTSEAAIFEAPEEKPAGPPGGGMPGGMGGMGF